MAIENESKAAATEKITVTRNGPYVVQGGLPLANQTIVSDAEGGSRDWRQSAGLEVAETYSLCRCGQSSNKPFCDGTHMKVEFDGTETASKALFLDEARIVEGPKLDLIDNPSFCVGARFCDPDGTIWRLIARTENSDVQETVKNQGRRCPSGRLVVMDVTSLEPYEPNLEPSLGLVQDPVAGVSGPIWARGGIAIESAGGFIYEIRNRVTLCRCGASGNKPFCDGSHVTVGFIDGLAED